MKYHPKYSRQEGGDIRKWSNPQSTFSHHLLKVNFDYVADPYPGILIVADKSYKSASAMAVNDLRKEIPTILGSLCDETVAYWHMERDQSERNRVLLGLTSNPIFDDVLG